MVVRIKSTRALLKTLADAVGVVSTGSCGQQQTVHDWYLRILFFLNNTHTYYLYTMVLPIILSCQCF
jgi:hypothetical protein